MQKRDLDVRALFISLAIILCGPIGISSGEDNRASPSQSQDLGPSVHAHERKDSDQAKGEIGVEERLGLYVPLVLSFSDETGKPVRLEEIVDRPTIVAPVFLSCRSSCPMLLGSLASALGKISLRPGEAYTAVAVSFDDEDTPAIASQAKINYLTAVGSDYPEAAWRFLTGSGDAIKAFMDAMGFRFRREKEGFSHPVVLIILSPKGKIVRYLYGAIVQPFDLNMALVEASEEREGLSIKKGLLYCFSYDPKEKKYVFNTMRVVGTATIIFVAGFFIYLVVSGRRTRKKGQPYGDGRS